MHDTIFGVWDMCLDVSVSDTSRTLTCRLRRGAHASGTDTSDPERCSCFLGDGEGCQGQFGLIHDIISISFYSLFYLLEILGCLLVYLIGLFTSPIVSNRDYVIILDIYFPIFLPCYVKCRERCSTYLFVMYRLMMADCAQLGRLLSGVLRKIGQSG